MSDEKHEHKFFDTWHPAALEGPTRGLCKVCHIDVMAEIDRRSWYWKQGEYRKEKGT